MRRIGILYIAFIVIIVINLFAFETFADETLTNSQESKNEQKDSVNQQKTKIEPQKASEQNTAPQKPLFNPKTKPPEKQTLPKQLLNPTKTSRINQEPRPVNRKPTAVKQQRPPQDRQRSQQMDNKELSSSKRQKTEHGKIQLFGDEYSELDDISGIDIKDNDVVIKTLEHARQKYIQAKIFFEKGDTITSSSYYDKAIEILNRISAYPGIEKNIDFTDLAKSIMEDYEKSIGGIENLNDESPFFAIRDKLFNQIDLTENEVLPKLKKIEIPKDTIVSLVGSKPIIPEPKALVINLDENEEVLKNIEFLTKEGAKGGRRFFKKWLERTTRWFPKMRQIAAEEEVPEELIYLSMIESGLRPDAVSKSNAVGLWQFIRTSGQDYGLNVEPSPWFDERRDPEKSTRAAMRYLKDLYNQFNDWHLALAAYNCGQGRVRRTLKTYGTDSSTYWDIREKLPKETQHYVPIYIACARISLNPEAYGFNLDSLKFEPEYVYDTYTISEPISISVIAKCADTTREYIQSLNPELLRTITPPDVESYTIKLPKNKVKLFVANYSTLTPLQKQPWIEHKVAPGETIAKIARQYEVSRNEIATSNGLPSYRTKVKVGTILKIPIDKDYYAEKKRQEELKQYNVAISTKVTEDQKAKTHTVKPGESLYSIANKYGIRLTDLRNINNIAYDDDNIGVGQKLIIPASQFNGGAKGSELAKSEDNSTDESNLPNLVRHKVKEGETLHAIAENYNVTVESIKEVNNLKEDKVLQGQVIAIKVLGGNSSDVTVKTSNGKTIYHQVKPDETIGTIAGIYGVTEENLVKWNSDKIDGSTVKAGSILKIEEPVINKGSASSTPKNVNKPVKYYKVKKGETLFSVSRKFGISVNDLKSLNKNLDPDNIKAGERIRIQ